MYLFGGGGVVAVEYIKPIQYMKHFKINFTQINFSDLKLNISTYSLCKIYKCFKNKEL